MKLHQSLNIIIVLMLVLSAFSARAATGDSPLVEVHVPQDVLAPYRERRGTHGMYFGVDYEALILKNFFSASDGSTYNDLFGSDVIGLMRLSIDYKYNFLFGALTLGGDVGIGSVSGKSSRKLDVTKYGVGIKYVMDALMPEPYVAPYVGVNFWKIATKESSDINTNSKTTNIGYNYTVGLLIQLDWIDFNTAKEATFNYGLENTYLDIYATQYAKTGNEADIDTTTAILWGAGLKFEF